MNKILKKIFKSNIAKKISYKIKSNYKKSQFIDIHGSEFIERIHYLKQSGLTYNEIGNSVQVGVPTIKRLFRQYPIIFQKECVKCHILFSTLDKNKKSCLSCSNPLNFGKITQKEKC